MTPDFHQYRAGDLVEMTEVGRDRWHAYPEILYAQLIVVDDIVHHHSFVRVGFPDYLWTIISMRQDEVQPVEIIP